MFCDRCSLTDGELVEMEPRIAPESGGCMVCPKCGFAVDCEEDEGW